MINPMNIQMQRIIDGLMSRYSKRVPDVPSIIETMRKEKLINGPGDIENDHIAFRTIGVPHLGIRSLEKIFINGGYKKMDYYFFPEKKLNAFWYSPPAPQLPRIFISELRVGDLSELAQKTISKYTSQVQLDPVDYLDLNDTEAVDEFLHSSLWTIPTWDDYLLLSKESEYAAWVIFNGYYLNHFTISVHNLKSGYNTILLFNNFLEKNGFTLNDSGGKFKQSPDQLLIQSSTVAQLVEAEFSDGSKHPIAGSYVEFAERCVLPEYVHLPSSELKAFHRREGFEVQNANRIFESTYNSQTHRALP